MSLSGFLEDCLVLDLEVSANERVRDVGAIRGNSTLRIRDAASSTDALRQLDEFSRGAKFIVGHNLIAHDRRFIEAYLPGAALLNLSVVDTLYLSPLATPQRPYHPLVKDYKLVGGERNDPVSDCKLALTLLKDCWNTLKRREQEEPGLVSIYRTCFHDSDAPGGTSPLKLNGTGQFLDALGARMFRPDRAQRGFAHFAHAKACPTAMARELPPLLADPITRPAVAYSLAWLTVAGTESVLPRWVYRNFPAAPQLLQSIRGTNCNDPECAYCPKQHNARKKLTQYFGHPSFRPTPATTDGESLQERIVSLGLASRPLLGILPTGGGKSLCFQLPAIMQSERTGALTVVISPLQALMKDQVENLNTKTGGASLAAALNGLLTMPERHDVLEGVRMGRFALLYVSPEQLRNRGFKNAISQREIAAWVFDEAHCISKWGHDFRPDYLYAARFIRELAEREGVEAPPVACFTATAKLDVREEIVAHFREELGQEIEVLAADRIDRTNLHYTVEEVTSAQKATRIGELLEEHIGRASGETTASAAAVPAADAPGEAATSAAGQPTGASQSTGAAIVYASRRKQTERLAAALRGQGWKADHFHAGLDPPDKKRIQDAFISGNVPVIVATNAFGMGIDKDNVRLVVHADVPGSIENYLQEAGRAGRDGKPAHCVLLFAKGDLDTQFDLASQSRLTQRDISQILSAIRRARRRDTNEVVLSPGELLRVPDTEVSFGERGRSVSTKVKTAISWLERARFLWRNENRTHVFQGVPAVRDLDAAKKKMDRLDLPEHVRRRWLEVLRELQTADLREGIDADDLAHLPSFRSLKSRVGEEAADRDRTATREILRTLDEMTRAGLLTSGIYFSAWVRHKIKGRSLDRLADIVAAERAVLEVLRAEEPDASPGYEVSLSVARLQERLRSEQVKIARETLLKLLAGWAREGIDCDSLIHLRSGGRRNLRVRFHVDWPKFQAQLELRAEVGQTLLHVLLEHAEREGLTGERLVRFSLDELRRALEERSALGREIKDAFNAIEKTLLFLDEHDVIKLEKGLAIFRQAMTIEVLDEAKRRRYSRGDYRPLEEHYGQRVCQIHAMGRYVDEAHKSLDGGRRYVQDYFSLGSPEFVKHYFGDDAEVLERATSRESFAAIVESLRNPAQEQIVTAPKDRNMLVLAGPGSGKTRVVIHRCAYLLRVERIRPENILVICFNRSAMHELRVRLRDLVGTRLARQVAVLTYHALALRLTERSMVERAQAAGEERIDFDSIIDEANRRLRGEDAVVGVEPDELRDRLLSGFEYVLVDEYQDIDARQYELITHIARRSEEGQEADRRAAILAVGDDDQSIYEWREASVRFLRRFEEEFSAQRHYLVENYRSTRRIVEASNALIRYNADRLKVDRPIRVNVGRSEDPPGGEWESLDPFARGRVSLIEVEDDDAQARSVVAELERLRGLDRAPDWQKFAILGRTHDELVGVRALLELSGVPIRRALPDGLPPLWRIREFARLLCELKNKAASNVSIPRLRAQLDRVCGATSFWTAMADRMLAGHEVELGAASCGAVDVLEALHRGLADHHRSHIVGDGALLSTVHAAKGLEFDHVLVLGGGWNRGPDGRNHRPGGSVATPWGDRHAASAGDYGSDEERRLYYVAMTRSRKTLTLFDRQDDPLAYAQEVAGTHVRLRRPDVVRDSPRQSVGTAYTMLGMKDLYLDFAGRKPRKHQIHRSLKRLQTSDAVQLRSAGNGRVLVLDSRRTAVARLANSAADGWAQSRLQRVEEVRVVGMASRTRDDCAPEFQDAIVVSEWELPILEVRLGHAAE